MNGTEAKAILTERGFTPCMTFDSGAAYWFRTKAPTPVERVILVPAEEDRVVAEVARLLAQDGEQALTAGEIADMREQAARLAARDDFPVHM